MLGSAKVTAYPPPPKKKKEEEKKKMNNIKKSKRKKSKGIPQEKDSCTESTLDSHRLDILQPKLA